jgi:hypothetical protein
MFVLIRLGIMAFSGWMWNVSRKSAWMMRCIPWLKLVTFFTALAMLVSLVLEIIIKMKVINS